MKSKRVFRKVKIKGRWLHMIRLGCGSNRRLGLQCKLRKRMHNHYLKLMTERVVR